MQFLIHSMPNGVQFFPLNKMSEKEKQALIREGAALDEEWNSAWIPGREAASKAEEIFARVRAA